MNDQNKIIKNVKEKGRKKKEDTEMEANVRKKEKQKP
jgi:hypothetical protein